MEKMPNAKLVKKRKTNENDLLNDQNERNKKKDWETHLVIEKSLHQTLGNEITLAMMLNSEFSFDVDPVESSILGLCAWKSINVKKKSLIIHPGKSTTITYIYTNLLLNSKVVAIYIPSEMFIELLLDGSSELVKFEAVTRHIILQKEILLTLGYSDAKVVILLVNVDKEFVKYQKKVLFVDICVL